MSGSPVVISPSTGWRFLDVRDLWAYRDLLGILVWRDLKVRYKRTIIGVAWVLVQPTLSMLVFWAIFARLGAAGDQTVPYPLVAFAGLLPWQFFARALTEASTSLVVAERVISKVYFPRLLVPTAVILAGLVDLGVGLMLCLVLLVVFGAMPGATLLLLPACILLAMVTALGTALWLSALDVQYRDVRHTLPFLSQLWLFLSPVAYSSRIVPDAWRPLYALNPMVGVIEGFRYALLGDGTRLDVRALAISVVVAVGLFASGVVFFRSVERTLADHL